MLIVDIKDVRITQIPDAQSPTGEISILYYLNDVYILLKQFPEGGIDLAKSFYQKTIDERGWECLILDWEQNYSLWVSRSAVASSASPQNPLSTVFGAQMYLLAGISQEIAHFMGVAQQESFERSILAGIPSIGSLLELRQIMVTVVQEPQKSLQKYQPNASQLQTIYQNLLEIASQYLDKGYTAELIEDLRTQMPPIFAKAMDSWLKR
jgi:hypothetical protein